MSPKGGKRPGAGRKPIRGERKRQFGIWLPPSLSAWLDALVAQTGRSRSELIAEALEALRAGPAPVPQAEPVPAGDARDAEAYRALLEALAAAEVPAGPLAQYNLPQALARQVAEAIAPTPSWAPGSRPPGSRGYAEIASWASAAGRFAFRARPQQEEMEAIGSVG